MAPEVCKLERMCYSEAADIWSLGLTLFAMLRNGYLCESAKDLIRRLAVRNPELRLKPDDIVAHPWCVGHDEMPSPLPGWLAAHEEQLEKTKDGEEDISVRAFFPQSKRSRR